MHYYYNDVLIQCTFPCRKEVNYKKRVHSTMTDTDASNNLPPDMLSQDFPEYVSGHKQPNVSFIQVPPFEQLET